MDQVAVVIGGASGIGAACVVALRDDGCRRRRRRPARVRRATWRSTSATRRWWPPSSTASSTRAGRVDVVVNSAGTSTLSLVVDHDAADFRRVVDVNLTGGFLVLKHAGRVLGEGGSVVSLTSLNARQPGAGMAAYCSAKAGLAMLTQVAALELGPRGIRVNAISPGLVVTPLTAPAMDIAGIEDDYLANTPARAVRARRRRSPRRCVFVSKAAWLTGEVLDLNGGAHLMRYPDLVGHVTRAFS